MTLLVDNQLIDELRVPKSTFFVSYQQKRNLGNSEMASIASNQALANSLLREV